MVGITGLKESKHFVRKNKSLLASRKVVGANFIIWRKMQKTLIFARSNRFPNANTHFVDNFPTSSTIVSFYKILVWAKQKLLPGRLKGLASQIVVTDISIRFTRLGTDFTKIFFIRFGKDRSCWWHANNISEGVLDSEVRARITCGKLALKLLHTNMFLARISR